MVVTFITPADIKGRIIVTHHDVITRRIEKISCGGKPDAEHIILVENHPDCSSTASDLRQVGIHRYICNVADHIRYTVQRFGQCVVVHVFISGKGCKKLKIVESGSIQVNGGKGYIQ